MLRRLLLRPNRLLVRRPYLLLVILMLALMSNAAPSRTVPLLGASAPDDPRVNAVSRSATSSTPNWQVLPNRGLDHIVYATVLIGDDMYVGGEFSQTGDASLTNLGNIARYDTSTGTWHPLANQGLSNGVRALAVIGDDLYAGGTFTQTADGTITDLGRVARYDTATDTWHALPNQGVDDAVWALAASGDDLYVGGRFTQSGDGTVANLNRLARYDSTGNVWETLPKQGLNWFVFSLTFLNDDLYVGGLFNETGDGTLTNFGHIARFDTAGDTWHHLPKQGLDNGVYAVHVSGSKLYIGGTFTQTGDGTQSLGKITSYNTSTGVWQSPPNQGLDEGVLAIDQIGDDLFVGGMFTETGDGTVTNLGRIVRFDIASGTWHALPNEGVNSWVNTLLVLDDDLYVGGHFNITGDASRILNHLVRLGDNSVYVPLALHNQNE